jgi:hypothetical protein
MLTYQQYSFNKGTPLKVTQSVETCWVCLNFGMIV